jgi:hypothetical protein
MQVKLQVVEQRQPLLLRRVGEALHQQLHHLELGVERNVLQLLLPMQLLRKLMRKNGQNVNFWQSGD